MKLGALRGGYVCVVVKIVKSQTVTASEHLTAVDTSPRSLLGLPQNNLDLQGFSIMSAFKAGTTWERTVRNLYIVKSKTFLQVLKPMAQILSLLVGYSTYLGQPV